ncbi:dehydrogenase/reductase SDR family member 12 [Elysia marginata]|uniref:Dehydrogenase/reductase SDR family member 12 n=1 Tax=Elysia marginata TaxID=1093978 RepID=A0AAV4IGM1_9GAST|nr:dehydrogenase/reductase SDR family member 12 [Elysia marginata]
MSLFRNAIWFLKGMKEYTKGGYEAAAKKFNPADLDVSLLNRSFMITGANSGVGKCTALAIAKKDMILRKKVPCYHFLKTKRLYMVVAVVVVVVVIIVVVVVIVIIVVVVVVVGVGVIMK